MSDGKLYDGWLLLTRLGEEPLITNVREFCAHNEDDVAACCTVRVLTIGEEATFHEGTKKAYTVERISGLDVDEINLAGDTIDAMEAPTVPALLPLLERWQKLALARGAQVRQLREELLVAKRVRHGAGERAVPEAPVCNAPATTGEVCGRPRGHDGEHAALTRSWPDERAGSAPPVCGATSAIGKAWLAPQPQETRTPGDLRAAGLRVCTLEVPAPAYVTHRFWCASNERSGAPCDCQDDEIAVDVMLEAIP